MEQSNKEKFEMTIKALEEDIEELPTEVVNNISDAFNENPIINNVEIYYKENLEELQERLKLKNIVICQLDGKSQGKINNAFTYFGDIKYSLSEYVSLNKGEEILEVITNIDNSQFPSIVVDKDDYAVVLIEILEWENGEYKRSTPVLYVYCPITIDDPSEIEEEEGK